MLCSACHMRWVLRLTFWLVLAISGLGCSHQPPPFLGKWVMEASGGESYIVFNTDGTGRINAEMFLATLNSPFTWHQEGTKLVAKMDLFQPGKAPSNVRPEDTTLTLGWIWSVNDQSLTLTDESGHTEVYHQEKPAAR